MLQNIRELTQGWIAGVIIGIIILTFALWGIHSYFEGNANNAVVAEVNGTNISKEQLAVAYERLRRQAQSQPGVLQNDTNLKQHALEALIEREVLKQASLDQGFKISGAQIDGYLESIPEFQINGQFSLDRFQEVLSSTMLNTGEFLDLIGASLLIDQPKLGIIFGSFVMPDEVASTVAIVNQERDVSYINIPLQKFLSGSIAIPAEKVQAYYEQHKKDFMTPEQVTTEYLELSLKDVAATIHTEDETLKQFYNENINAYTQPMAWKVMDVLVPLAATATPDDVKKAQEKAHELAKAINSGGDFSRAAHDYPGALSGQTWVTLSIVPPELQKAMASLSKAGQVSDVLRTSNGFVMLKAIAVREPKIETFDAVKTKVNEMYVRQRAEEKFAEVREQLADMTYEHPDSLAFAAKALNLPIKTSELFSADKGGKDISQYKKVRTTAFSNDVLNLQNNSEVIQINPETVVVLRVKSHLKSSLLPLTEVSKQIEDKLKAQEAELLAGNLANELVKKLQAGEAAEQVAAAHQLTWSKAGMLGRYATKVDSAILDLAFRLPNPTNAGNKPTYGVTRLTNGFAIVALAAVKSGAVADNKQYMVFAEQVQNSDGMLEYELYKQSQIANAKIKTYQQ